MSEYFIVKREECERCQGTSFASIDEEPFLIDCSTCQKKGYIETRVTDQFRRRLLIARKIYLLLEKYLSPDLHEVLAMQEIARTIEEAEAELAITGGTYRILPDGRTVPLWPELPQDIA